MSTISDNLQAVRQKIVFSTQSSGRDAAEVNLLAVSKTFGVEAVLDAAMAGQRAFGENYLQEAIDKIAAVKRLAPDLVLEWHFIGPIQRNKTRLIAENFSWVHAVDRLIIAERLSEQRPGHLPPLNVCLQVNISDESSKSGVPLNEAVALAKQIATLPHIRLRGLMAIPEPETDLALQRVPYAALRQLQIQLNQQGLMLDTLSMGMSADLTAAILEGSTLVRVGSAIFGKRDYANHDSSNAS
jgi:pyridoxal phosphate enzyme (YggS family)